MPGTEFLYHALHVILTAALLHIATIMPVLDIRKLRHRKVKCFICPRSHSEQTAERVQAVGVRVHSPDHAEV